jgi:hypothetical protein
VPEIVLDRSHQPDIESVQLRCTDKDTDIDTTDTDIDTTDTDVDTADTTSGGESDESG